jgi:ABC-type antimicrobial peptide transport system permease subunit
VRDALRHANQKHRAQGALLHQRAVAANPSSAARVGDGFSVVMGSIAEVSPLVGGIDIMNIMLANVLERRREIGLLRAIGARR